MTSLMEQAKAFAELFSVIDDDALDKITAETLATYTRRADLETAVYSSVRATIRCGLRNATANIEASAPLRIAKFTEPTGEADDPIARRNALLNKAVFIPDRGRIMWGDCTIDDHEARIGLLEGYAAGNLASAGKHKEAISVIRSTPGAVTMFDVASKAAA